jgi:hypothetical protein
MKERICTKAQKDASWKEKGLLKLPKSHDQGSLAIAAKEFIEGLRCYPNVRRMLAMGKRPRDVAIHIQQQNEFPILTFSSLKKYAQVYRCFFISGMEVVRVQAKELETGHTPVIRHQLELLQDGIKEIRELEHLMDVQMKRICEQIEKEKQLGLPLSGIRLEIEAVLKLINTLIEKKIELGIYTRAPMDPYNHVRPGLARLDLLTTEQRQRVSRAGTAILQMLEAARSSATQ